MFSLGIGAKVGLVMGVLLLAMAGGFALYYKTSQAKIAELNQTLGIEKTARASAEANLEQVRSQVAAQTGQLSRLADEMAASRKAQEKVVDIFANHDLNKITAAKPDLVQTRVNNGTKVVLKELETITNPETYKTKKPE